MSRRDNNRLRIPLRNETEQMLMRKAGRIVALALAKMGETIVPGITTGELDAVAEQTIRGLGAKPAFLGYNGFPATACISINDEVVHGIPGPAILKDGDIVGIDLGAIVDGWYADSAFTFSVGNIDENVKNLLEIGQESLAIGIQAAKPGNSIRDIGAAIQQFSESRGVSVVRELCGHGIGRHLHEEPQIPNYVTRGGNIELRPGMTLAIEPMLNAGEPRVKIMDDNWTFVTVDGSLSVHYEHTVLITENGAEILTSLR
ncbi:MAG TPA: type I methionyl aminopeptidase [Armatimonadota bacterium]|nr:type I methionyl aminopeptidase [Armatimonadota bacterium]